MEQRAIDKTPQTCPHCNTPGLKLKFTNNTWRLAEPNDEIHFCPTYTSKKHDPN